MTDSQSSYVFSYYFVPCFYIGEKKMMEGVPTPEKVRETLLAALD